MSARHAARPVRVPGWFAWCLGATAFFLLPWPTRLVDEFYSRGVYPWIQLAVTTASNQLPLAIMDAMIGLAVVGVLARGIMLGLAVRTRGPLAVAWEGLRRLVRAVAIVVVAFLAMWGLNYRRLPLEDVLNVRGKAPTDVAVLRAAIADADALATRIRPQASAALVDYQGLADRLYAPMNEALATLRLRPLARAGRPKFSVLLTPFFTRAGVDGMVNPLALESLIQPALLPFERASVLAHEWGHLAGLADEAEASAVGWFACMLGPPEFVYSASLTLILESVAALPPGAHREAWGRLTPEVRADLDAIRRRLTQRQPQVQRAASEVYDRYLKANRVEDGTASYSRALTLILAEPLRGALTRAGRPRT